MALFVVLLCAPLANADKSGSWASSSGTLGGGWEGASETPELATGSLVESDVATAETRYNIGLMYYKGDAKKGIKGGRVRAVQPRHDLLQRPSNRKNYRAPGLQEGLRLLHPGHGPYLHSGGRLWGAGTVYCWLASCL